MRLTRAVRATARRARLAARSALALAACFPLLVVAEPASREIAITFDDLPFVTKVEVWHEKITADLLAALVRHRVPAIGFVNERKLERDGAVDPRRVALLERWLAAGFELGNHGYAHLDLHAVPLADAENDVLRGERLPGGYSQPRAAYRAGIGIRSCTRAAMSRRARLSKPFSRNTAIESRPSRSTTRTTCSRARMKEH